MKRSKHKKSVLTGTEEELTFSKLLIRCLIISALFFLIAFIITVIVSLLFFNSSDPLPMANAAGIISVYASLLICGFILSKINSQKYILGGLTLGLIIMCIIMLMSIIFFNDEENGNMLFKVFIPFVTVLGSLFGIKKTHQKRHKHKKFNTL